MKLLLLTLIATLLFPANLLAGVSLGTTATIERTDLTIYSRQDLTFVREIRSVNLTEGTNQLSLTWDNKMIDPASLYLTTVDDLPGVTVEEQIFTSANPTAVSWKIFSQEAQTVQVEISYFMLGLNWSAEYMGKLDPTEETLQLSGKVTVKNTSGTSFENSSVHLFIGEVELLEKLANSIRQWRQKLVGEASPPVVMDYFAEQPQQMLRRESARALMAPAATVETTTMERRAEHYLLSLEPAINLADDQQKQLTFLPRVKLPVTTVYSLMGTGTNRSPRRLLKFTNETATDQEEIPLPGGQLQLLETNRAGHLLALGGVTLDYLPVGGTAELELDRDRHIRVSPTLQKQVSSDHKFNDEGRLRGWYEKLTFEVKVKNFKPVPITLHFYQDFPDPHWELLTELPEFKRQTARRLKLNLEIEAGQTRTIEYPIGRKFGELRD